MNLLISKYEDQLKLAIQLIGGFLVGYYLGRLIIRGNPFFLLISFSIPLGLILFTSPKTSLYIIIFSVFFADWFMSLGLIPPQMTLFPEVILTILTIKVVVLKIIDRKVIKTPINVPILLLVLWGVISTLVNSQHIGTTMVGFRFDLKYVLMFFLLVNLNPDEQFLKRMIYILIFLLIIQVPVALVKSTIYGQGEQAIGTYAVYGGAPSTMLPLIAISIFLGFYLYQKPRLRYVCLCLSFVLFAIVGGKRAFLFFGVFLFLVLMWQARGKNFGKLFFLSPFLIIGFLACIYFIPTLNPTLKNPQHLIDYTVSYSTAYSTQSGDAIGRTSALITAYNVAKKNAVNFLLGFGPGCLAQSYFKGFESRIHIPIAYGRSQWVTMSLEYGWVGAFLFLWLFIPLYKVNKRFFDTTSNKYWKAISFGFKGILFSYLMGFFYAVIFRDDVLGFIFWFFAATIVCLEKQKKIEEDSLQWNQQK